MDKMAEGQNRCFDFSIIAFAWLFPFPFVSNSLGIPSLSLMLTPTLLLYSDANSDKLCSHRPSLLVSLFFSLICTTKLACQCHLDNHHNLKPPKFSFRYSHHMDLGYFSKSFDNFFVGEYSILKSRSTEIQSLDTFAFWVCGSLSQNEFDGQFQLSKFPLDGS